jgi:hypothetical protein
VLPHEVLLPLLVDLLELLAQVDDLLAEADRLLEDRPLLERLGGEGEQIGLGGWLFGAAGGSVGEGVLLEFEVAEQAVRRQSSDPGTQQFLLLLLPVEPQRVRTVQQDVNRLLLSHAFSLLSAKHNKI